MSRTRRLTLVASGGLGAAQSGFQMSSQTMVLEFGARQDMPMRLGLSQTAQGFMNTIGPLIGGLIAITVGYRPLFVLSMVFEAIALGLLLWVVDEPRYQTTSGVGLVRVWVRPSAALTRSPPPLRGGVRVGVQLDAGAGACRLRQIGKHNVGHPHRPDLSRKGEGRHAGLLDLQIARPAQYWSFSRRL